MRTLHELAAALANGATTSRALVEECLDRIADPAGEGGRVFIKVYAAQARAMAEAADALRRANRAPPLAGIPISVKDLFDVAGEPTPAGSTVLADAPPAAAHAPVIARVLAAGLIPMGRTNMTEFAFSGLGINPHHGTPSSPWDRATRRIPGGSSSGAGVSVADGMAFGALGTDTGGSCRIPAAMCGVVGYKPTARRVPISGVLPLAPSLDSVGPLANSVACCAALDAVLAGEALPSVVPMPVAGLRLAVPAQRGVRRDRARGGGCVRAGVGPAVGGGRADRACDISGDGRGGAGERDGRARRARGLRVAPPASGREGRGVRPDGSQTDPARGGDGVTGLSGAGSRCGKRSARAWTRGRRGSTRWRCRPARWCRGPIAALEADEAEYTRVNSLQLRNTTLGNFLDRCAISLPCHRPGEAPVGLMLMGETMGDARLFAIAAGVEAALA